MPINPLSTDWLVGVPLGAGVLPTFGLPPCMFNLTMQILQMLPGDALAAISAGITKGIMLAQTHISAAKDWIFGLIGLKDDDGDGFYSWGLDTGLGGLGSFMDSLLGGVALGIGYVQEAQSQINATIDQINGIVACLESFMGQIEDSITTKTHKQRLFYLSNK